MVVGINAEKERLPLRSFQFYLRLDLIQDSPILFSLSLI
jgi:hypothetical protein